jgi:hypothetical protein
MELEPMSEDDARKSVLAMIKKADTATDAGEAMKMAQAALNAANALVAISPQSLTIARFPTAAQIKHMVDRFLGWPLPADFSPDGGVLYIPFSGAPSGTNLLGAPSGTNLLDGHQAAGMIEYILRDLPAA